MSFFAPFFWHLGLFNAGELKNGYLSDYEFGYGLMVNRLNFRCFGSLYVHHILLLMMNLFLV